MVWIRIELRGSTVKSASPSGKTFRRYWRCLVCLHNASPVVGETEEMAGEKCVAWMALASEIGEKRNYVFSFSGLCVV